MNQFNVFPQNFFELNKWIHSLWPTFNFKITKHHGVKKNCKCLIQIGF